MYTNGKFIPVADLKQYDVTAMGKVLAVRRTAKTTFITVNTVRGEVYTYNQSTNSNIMVFTEESK